MQLQPTPDLARALADAQAENRRLLRIIELKDEQIRLLNIRRFGPKGEKLSALQGALLFEEPSVTAQEVAQEAELPQPQKDQPVPRAKHPHPNHPGRERLPEHLERREEIIPDGPLHPVIPVGPVRVVVVVAVDKGMIDLAAQQRC